VMAITHSLAHSHPGPYTPPGNMLSYLNKKLCDQPAGDGTFVTAFYGVYNPRTRTLEYASAGHPSPRVRPNHSFDIVSLDGARTFPLGIDPGAEYDRATYTFSPGDLLLLYTDGITESFAPTGEMFTAEGLDKVLRSAPTDPQTIINSVRAAVDMFTHPNRAEDDRTLLAIRVT
jgi:phosphoserine phosphatase RsbU/P